MGRDGVGLVAGVEAVLLDMDGTLVDSDAAVERAWSTWATEHGVEPAAALAIAHGNPAETTVRALLPALGPPEVAASAARQLALQYDDLADTGPTEGAQRLATVLRERGWPWAVVTTADRRLAGARLAAAGLTVPLLVTADDVTAGKPDPEGYLLAARRLGVPPQRCLVVEDTATGLQAGRAAGARTAALKGEDGDLRLAHLGELADLLAGSTGSTGWTDDELRRIGDAGELQLASTRADGSLRPDVTMWVVRAGDDLYVRSAHGPDNPWYRRTKASGTGRVRAGGVERAVTFAEATPDAHPAIDAAYHAKYDRYGRKLVDTVVGPTAAAVTVRLVPAPAPADP